MPDRACQPSGKEKPQRLYRCGGCNRWVWGFTGSRARCRRRTCSTYSQLWAADQRIKLFRCLEQIEKCVIGAVTAPGADRLPWDEEWCSSRGPHSHSGPDGCRVHPSDAQAWNESASARWSALHQAATERAVRSARTSSRPVRPRSFVGRVFQLHGRGVLHVHPILDVSSPAQRAWAHDYLDALQELAPRYGFGFSQGASYAFSAENTGRSKAAYLSSYLVRGKGRSPAVGEVVHAAPELRNVVFVSNELTRGIWTMRSLRLKRYAYHLVRLDNVDPVKVWEVMALNRVTYLGCDNTGTPLFVDLPPPSPASAESTCDSAPTRRNPWQGGGVWCGSRFFPLCF